MLYRTLSLTTHHHGSTSAFIQALPPPPPLFLPASFPHSSVVSLCNEGIVILFVQFLQVLLNEVEGPILHKQMSLVQVQNDEPLRLLVLVQLQNELLHRSVTGNKHSSRAVHHYVSPKTRRQNVPTPRVIHDPFHLQPLRQRQESLFLPPLSDVDNNDTDTDEIRYTVTDFDSYLLEELGLCHSVHKVIPLLLGACDATSEVVFGVGCRTREG